MSIKYLRLSTGDLVPLEDVKRLSIVTDADRQSLSKLGPKVDANRFNTRIEDASGKKSYEPKTINEIAEQGFGLVGIGQGTFVPATNITKARNLTDQDRSRFQNSTGREVPPNFVAQVETKAGIVLASVPAETVLDRRSRPSMAPAELAKQNTAEPSMTERRDQVMSQAAPHQGGSVQTPIPDREL